MGRSFASVGRFVREAAGLDERGASDLCGWWSSPTELASFTQPSEVRFTPDLPRATLNKVGKAELRKQIAAETATECASLWDLTTMLVCDCFANEMPRQGCNT